MTNLLNVDEAIAKILENISPLPDETIPLMETLSRTLAADVVAEINLPPFANSSMDGYAVQSEDVQTATTEHPVSLDVVMDIPAGFAPQKRLQSGQAARIMTGAPLPDGADAVIPVEDTDSPWDRSQAGDLPEHVGIKRSVKAGDYVRPIGEDIQAGTTVLKKGTPIRAAEMGILAALGYANVKVFRKPRVAILSTGDELVRVDEPLTPGKIRDVNTYTLTGLLRSLNANVLHFPIAKDTYDAVRKVFDDAIAQQPDMIISSAGVSVGAADFVKEVLEELGSVNFWRINLRPGKPLAFGQLQGVPFFGLPGNPVSVMVTFEVLVRPAIMKMSGREVKAQTVETVVDENLTSDGRRSYLRVNLEERNGVLYATTTGTQSSGALMSMVLADGLLIVPEGVKDVPAGTKLAVYPLR